MRCNCSYHVSPPKWLLYSIVAIHGLDGHLTQSWTAENGTQWLRDLLPEKVPYARVLTYGYDGFTRGERVANESTHDLAKNLVSSLAIARREVVYN